MEYINAKRTPQEEAELRRIMLTKDNEIREQESNVIDQKNGTKTQIKTQIKTHSLK